MFFEQLLNTDTIVIIAVMATAGLVALALLQGASLRRRLEEMIQENSVAHGTLRTAADRLARMEVEKRGVEHDKASTALPTDLRERLYETARRGTMSVQDTTRLVLERGLANFDSGLVELASTAGIECGQEPIKDHPQAAAKDGSVGQ